jgi:FAD/FMN-containing dehydrogenase/Fe-S oxidoreductase
MLAKLLELQKKLKGDFHTDQTMRKLYATDASVYKEMPLAVAVPQTIDDIKSIISFASENGASIIPRTAGTSLAGQVVGNGIVVDVSKHFTKIIEVNKEEKWVRVEPGVIRDDLNKYLKPYGLFFAPETSTANRCMIGGMVGNNSCGAHSPIYGTTRDHLLELETILSDGSDATFKSLSKEEFTEKCKGDKLENQFYQHIQDVLEQEAIQTEIRKEFPKPEINRRNTGYAIDVLLESAPFTEGKEDFNFCKLLAGSEGTLAFTKEIKINLVDLPPQQCGILAIHSESINGSLEANKIALKYKPGASELMDKIILDCTKENINQSKNRFFIKGDPAAVLCVEFERETKEEIEEICEKLTAELKEKGLGYHYPVVWGQDTVKVWNLRKAGLGLLANIPGDAKAVACIEDTAVTTDDLPEFIEEFDQIMKKHDKESIYYAHAGDGEIHLRPILDLKKGEDRELFYQITDDVATLVKKYSGSLSGEHGDGRVRGPFVEKMIGANNYALLKDLKKTWDPNTIFNPGKIVDAAPMNEFLRYEKDQKDPEIETVLDFSETGGILAMAEKCNGTGLCRKTHVSGGTMCPSYMATKDEKHTTRARANILRDVLTNSTKANKFDSEEIKEVLDLCLECKGCKSDCPSNVDMAAMKSEFLQNYYDANGIPFASKMIANVANANAIFSNVSGLFNFFSKAPVSSTLIKKIMSIAPERTLPPLYKTTLRKWFKKNKIRLQEGAKPKGTVNFFADEVVNYNDVPIGIYAIELLSKIGYRVEIPQHTESGRPAISKGFLRKVAKIAEENVTALFDVVSDETPIIGIEPSGILTFRDEYPKLLKGDLKSKAVDISKNALLFEEFICREIEKGNITSDLFKDTKEKIKVHGHCHQKALSSVDFTKDALSLPTNFDVEEIPSGCCGMSGSFGYEAKNYETSMKIGELVLFPAVREAEKGTIIAAPGTSCRHQIKDGTDVEAKHPAQILFEALK